MVDPHHHAAPLGLPGPPPTCMIICKARVERARRMPAMHTRRRFLVGALAPMVLSAPAWAGVKCLSDQKLGGQLCKTYIDVKDAYQESYHARHEPEAIWI